MEIDELRKKVEEERKRVNAAAKKRKNIVTLILIVFYLLLFYFIGNKPEDIDGYFSLFLSATMAGCLHDAINYEIYTELYEREKSDSWFLRKLTKELHEKEEELFQQRIAKSKENIH